MTHRRLFLKDLTDQHLTWLQGALDCGPEVNFKQWVEDISSNHLAVFEVPGGLVGLKLEGKHVFVEFVCGKDMKPYAKDIVAAVRELAGNRVVEGFVVNPALVRFYRRLGFKPVGTYMRLDDGLAT